MCKPAAASSLFAATLLCVAALSGCGGNVTQSVTTVVTPPPTPPPVSGTYSGASFTGTAMAGKQPLVGATVQLYAAGTSGDGIAAGNLLAPTLTTDNNGAFTVPTGYTCPIATSQVYAIAKGGSPGASAPTNSAIAIMVALGACNQIASASHVVLNEVTTVSAVWALSQFMSTGGAIGASATNTTGLANAFAIAASLASPATGVSPGTTFPSNGISPASRIDSLGNLLNACTSTSATVCNQLFAAAPLTASGIATNTLDAALAIARHPSTNVTVLYALALQSSAFTPALAAAPADWTIFLTFSGGGMSGPTSIGLTSKGNLWVANYFGVASQFTPVGAPVFASGITGYGLSASYGLAVDSSDNAWIANDNYSGTITELSISGSALSGAGGYSAGGIEYPIAIAIDPDQSVWVMDYGDSHVTRLSTSGAPLSGASGYANNDIAFPGAIAVDANHNGWIADQSGTTIVRLSQDGTQAVSATCCSAPSGIALDQSGNAWVTNFYGNSVSEVSSSASVLSSGYTGGGLDRPQGIAIDGAGNVWVANFLGNGVTQLAGAETQAVSSGSLLCPPAGWAHDAPFSDMYGVAVDASGNVWVSNFGTNTITQLVGLAAPVKTPTVGLPQAP
jgi:streptogramin lyase